MMLEALAPLLFLAVPLLPVVLLPVLVHAPRLQALAPWVPASALALLPLQGVTVDFPWLLLGARVGLDPTFTPLLLLATVTWTLAGWHARRRQQGANAGRFWFFWLATWCGNLCVVLTQDAASFYAAYGMMTFAAWGLVVHEQRPADFHAGRVYLVMALIGEAMFLAALLAIGAQAGNIDLSVGTTALAELHGAGWISALLTVGFAVKMGVLGLHMWLPLAHPQAPVPASAVLSGVILKAGLAGWLVFLPLGAEGFAAVGTGLAAAGLITAFFGVGVGLCQDRPKVLLAYSSVSQMGWITLAVGMALREPAVAPALTAAAVLFALHHGLAKAALFVGVDTAAHAPRLARALLWLPAASLAGLPLTSGLLAKTALKSGLPADAAGLLEPLLFAASVGTVLLLARFLYCAWPTGGTRGDAALAAPWLALIAASLLMPWGWAILAEPEWIARAFTAAYLADVAVPLLAGGVIAVAASWLGRTAPKIAPGDALLLLPEFRRPPLPEIEWPKSLPSLRKLVAAEHRLLAPSVALVFWLSLMAVLFLAL